MSAPDWINRIHIGDCRDVMRKMIADGVKVQMCCCSPPYWGLRDYGVAGQLGLEPTIEEYVANMVDVFRLVRELLADDGTLWLNLGDSYNSIGHKKSNSGYGSTGLAGGIAHEHTPLRRENNSPGLKHKDLCMIPARVALALQADGWWLRDEIVWHKPNPRPSSVWDRTTPAHDMIYMLTKRARYYYDALAIREPASDTGRKNGREGRVESAAARPPGSNPNTLKRLDYTQPRKVKIPGGWDRGPGAHGTIHRSGRTEAEYQEIEIPGGRNKRSVWTVATQPFSARSLRGVSDDSRRTVSPDCPIHAVKHYLASKAASDALRAASQSDHSPRNDDHPELWPEAEHAPIETRHGADSFLDSSGSPGQPSAEIANGRSTENHKTDHAAPTSQRVICAVESALGTDDTARSPDLAANVARTPESKIAPDYGVGARVIDRAEQIPSGSVCTCSYEEIIDHFAVFPPKLIEPCILAGSRPGDVVFDPFMGSGTTGEVAQRLGRNWLGIELNPAYAKLAEDRTSGTVGMQFAEASA